MNVLIFCSIAVGAALAVAGALLYRLHRQIQMHQEIQSEFARVEEEVVSLSGRFSVINSHAVDYINSLGPDIAGEIYHVQKILHAANAALAEAQLLLASDDVSSLARAQALLDKHFITDTPGSSSVIDDGTFDATQYKELTEDWKFRVEDDLQKIGKAIVEASARATETGLPKRRKRKSTHLALRQIGIDDEHAPHTSPERNKPKR